MTKRSLCMAAFVVFLAHAPLGWAESEAPTADDIRQAGEAFSEGQRAYKAKEFGEAAEHFEAADGHAPSVNALRGAVGSRQKAEQIDRAATLAALALDRHPDDAELKDFAAKVIAELGPRLYRVDVRCEAPCELVIGTWLVHGKPASQRTVFLLPGQHTVRASFRRGGSASQEVEAVPGGQTTLNLQASPGQSEETTEQGARPSGGLAEEPGAREPIANPPEPTQPPAGSGRGWSPAVFWTGVGITAVLGGITAWSGIDTLANPGQDRVKQECAGEGTSCPLYQDGVARQTRTNVLAVATGVVGLATVITGVALTDWNGRPRTEPPREETSARWIRPYLNLGQGAELGAVGRF